MEVRLDRTANPRHIPVLGQLTPAQLPLSDALEAGALEVVGFNAALGGGALRQYPLEHTARHPDDTPVLADLNPEPHGLPVGIPAGVLITAFATPRHRVELAWRQRLVRG
jgi:hypothetical protein